MKFFEQVYNQFNKPKLKFTFHEKHTFSFFEFAYTEFFIEIDYFQKQSSRKNDYKTKTTTQEP